MYLHMLYSVMKIGKDSGEVIKDRQFSGMQIKSEKVLDILISNPPNSIKGTFKIYTQTKNMGCPNFIQKSDKENYPIIQMEIGLISSN